MARGELAHAVARRLRMGEDRQPLEVPPHVRRHLLRRRVALVRLRAYRLADDDVEVPVERAGEARRGGAAPRCAQLRGGCVGNGERRRAAGMDGRLPRVGVASERREPGQEFAQQQPELVDIGPRRDRSPTDLLGARIVGCEHPGAGRRVPGVALDQLGDPEIEELHATSVVDQDVRRLDVAVHHQLLVGRVHRARDLQEEIEPIRHAELRGVGALRDRHAVHQFHHQVRPTVGEGATVEKLRNVRVTQGGEDLPLVDEAAHQVLRVESPSQHLERDLLLVDAVRATRFVHRRHSPPPPSPRHDVSPDRGPRREIAPQLPLVFVREGATDDRARRAGHSARVSVHASEQSKDEVVERPVGTSRDGEVRGTFVGRQVEQLVEELIDLVPSVPEQVVSGRHALDGKRGGNSKLPRATVERSNSADSAIERASQGEVAGLGRRLRSGG